MNHSMLVINCLTSITLLMLAACQPLPVAGNSALNSIDAGMTVVLNQDLVIPPGQARVYIQHGVTVNTANIDRYQPWCDVEVNTLHTSATIIHADSFRILKKVNERSGLMDGSAFSAMGSPLEEFTTILYLKSEQQPDVLRLSCTQRRGSRMQTYLKPTNIQSTLGKLILIKSQ